MKQSNFAFILLAIAAIVFYSCDKNEKSIWGNDPKGAESIYECSINSGGEGFEVVKDKDTDGSYCISVEHRYFPNTELYRLFSPNGNLRVIASGAQEQCGLGGYRIDYDKNGRVCNVIYIGGLDDEEYRKLGTEESSVSVMKRWFQMSLEENPAESDSTFIKRDQDGNITSLKDIDIPYDYRAKLYLKEWGPFWESDINGGYLGLFLMVEKYQDLNGSHVNYLYLDGKLLAELAYWKGVFIKARTYNREGVMVNKYTDRDIDIWQQIYNDYNTTPTWYVD